MQDEALEAIILPDSTFRSLATLHLIQMLKNCHYQNLQRNIQMSKDRTFDYNNKPKQAYKNSK